ncbi:hypothetical protein IW261DRAFT_1475325, partial [Armillaria novae-zelandiae]
MDRLSRRLVATFLNSVPQTVRHRTMPQFHDMAGQFGWRKEIRHNKLRKIQRALVRQFDEMYGGNKRLCEVVSRGEIVPNDIDACKEVIKSVQVNIYDLVDHSATKVSLPIHETETALSKGTAEGHEMLRLFLRNILREQGKSSST